jgi:hypothetical protein
MVYLGLISYTKYVTIQDSITKRYISALCTTHNNILFPWIRNISVGIKLGHGLNVLGFGVRFRTRQDIISFSIISTFVLQTAQPLTQWAPGDNIP